MGLLFEQVLAAGESVSASAERIDLWLIPADVDPDEREKFREVLSGTERDRVQRFKFDRLKERFITIHGALRLILSAYCARPAADLDFSTGPNGKPALIDSGSRIEFNLSHSGAYALIGVTAGCPCGVDIEEIRREVSTGEIAERFFAPAESRWLNSLSPDQRQKAFFRVWTVKEAIIKTTGMGLSTPLTDFDTVTVVQNGRASLRVTPTAEREIEIWTTELDLVPGYAGAVAVEGGEHAIRVVRPGWRAG